MQVLWYEAPPGATLPGLVEPVDAPSTIRVIARPGMQTLYPLLSDMLKSLGADTDIPQKGKHAATPATLATAWSLVNQVHTVYLGEAQDLSPLGLEEVLDFVERIGARLHLIFAAGTLHQHAPLLARRGGDFHPFDRLPAWVETPPPSITNDHAAMTTQAASAPPELDDDWVSFRAAYHALYTPEETEACDRIYGTTLRTVSDCTVTNPDDIARLIAGSGPSTDAKAIADS